MRSKGLNSPPEKTDGAAGSSTHLLAAKTLDYLVFPRPLEFRTPWEAWFRKPTITASRHSCGLANIFLLCVHTRIWTFLQYSRLFEIFSKVFREKIKSTWGSDKKGFSTESADRWRLKSAKWLPLQQEIGLNQNCRLRPKLSFEAQKEGPEDLISRQRLLELET